MREPLTDRRAVFRAVALPPAVAGLAAESLRRSRDLLVLTDPPGCRLGSGGALVELVRALEERGGAGGTGAREPPRAVAILGGGESPGLPAYAPGGVPLLPVPSAVAGSGARPEGLLLDLQLRAAERLLRHAPSEYRLLVACGDVLLGWDQPLPPFPHADVLVVGVRSSPREASRHGVAIARPGREAEIDRYLQKPEPERVEELAPALGFWLDSGAWLLSRRAIERIEELGSAAREAGRPFDLFGGLGPKLGRGASDSAAVGGDLTAAVLGLERGRFYHFDSTRNLVASFRELRCPSSSRHAFGAEAEEEDEEPLMACSRRIDDLPSPGGSVWIDRSSLGRGWKLGGRNALTGVPPNDWTVELAPGVCLDFVPVGGGDLCVRVYGFEDGCNGGAGESSCEQRIAAWLEARCLPPEAARLPPGGRGVLDRPLYPIFATGEVTERFLGWLTSPDPVPDEESRRKWLRRPRLSARELAGRADVGEILRDRVERARRELSRGLDCRLDLAVAAELLEDEESSVAPGPAAGSGSKGVPSAHRWRMFASEGERRRGGGGEEEQEAAFAELRRSIISGARLEPALPRRDLLDDQLVWARSPVRLDLAGGWSDTPPYCIERGGRVVNLAVDLGGQPPVQVFARWTAEPRIVLRSVDLGLDERIDEREELLRPAGLGSGFGIARGALALAGFDPRFHAGRPPPTLRGQLERELGGGIELSMVCAVPKGSGLGTSSVLSSTILAALSEVCGLGWSREELFARTLVLEQILGSGGGWQDQAGSLWGGIKLVETEPGPAQRPILRWLPERLLADGTGDPSVLLYYTGITRTARDILGEIVRAMALGSARCLDLVEDIARNAEFAAERLQRGDREGLAEAVRRSWTLNRELDPGTDPPEVRAILERVESRAEAAKLLGAGGGGYLLTLARSAEAGREIRRDLEERPPNPRARFVEFSLSGTGLQVTRS